MVSLDSLPPLVTRAVAVVGAIFDVLGTILVDGRLASEGESSLLSQQLQVLCVSNLAGVSVPLSIRIVYPR